MQYNINYNETVVTLPKYSLKIAEMLEQQDKINSSPIKFREKCKTMFTTLENIIGNEKISELLGKFEECDPNDINLLYLSVIKAYGEPLNSYNTDSVYNSLNDMQVDKLTRLMEALEKANKLHLNK